jgi:glycogen operon protein
VVDDCFLVMFNAHSEDVAFTLPPPEYGEQWSRVLDTADTDAAEETAKAGETVPVAARSVVLLQRESEDAAD